MDDQRPKGGTDKAPKKKRGFEVSIDSGTIKTAKDVAKKLFKRKKKNRDLSSPRG